MAIKTQQERREEYLKDHNAEKQSQINTSNQIYNSQKQQVQDTYNTQIADAEESYEDLYRENEVQRLVNQRQLNESMANLGLTNSGLNRTQQTAVQLSYANQKGEISREKQKALDTLSSALASAITDIENNRAAAQASIEDTYARNADTYAQNMYSTDVQAETQRLKDQLEAENEKIRLQNEKDKLDYEYNLKMAEAARQSSYIIKTDGALLSRNYKGTLQDNGVSVYEDPDKPGNWIYIDSNSGKRTSLPKNVNPYKGYVHADAQYGTFSNGYQPDNLGKTSRGTIRKLTAVKNDKNQTEKMTINNNSQTIWQYGGAYYVWDTTAGKAGDYIQVKTVLDRKSGKVQWVVA